VKIIQHRRNTIADLKDTPRELGVEIDLRTHAGKIILQHEAFEPGSSFETWLEYYRHGTLILNVKEDGLEEALLRLMKKHRIEDFFFLDQPFPTLARMARIGEKRCAIRFSEYESIETLATMAGKLEWVWVDCFTRFPLNAESYRRIRTMGYKICLVSPELQGRMDGAEIMAMQQTIHDNKMEIDAVCTKKPELWQAR
jgi:hypothetical protein